MLSLGGLNRACSDPFFFPIFWVAERNGLVQDGKEVDVGVVLANQRHETASLYYNRIIHNCIRIR